MKSRSKIPNVSTGVPHIISPSIRSAYSLTPPKKDQQVALSISFPTKPPEHQERAQPPPVENFQGKPW